MSDIKVSAKCFLINVASIMSRRDELHFLTDAEDLHFVFIAERWLHDYIPISEIFNCNLMFSEKQN